MIDFKNSNAAKEAQKDDLKMLVENTIADQSFAYTFAGAELMWNNKFRLRALQEGIENFLPQILYLIRPETAYTAALHYVAKELGGIEGYLDQRRFIFQNPGIRNILENFWEKVQLITWSGAFSPSLSSAEKTQIILALTEAFHYTITTGSGREEDAPLVPHLEPSILVKAGIHIPSLTFPDMTPTPTGIANIKDMQKRQNFPGIPSDTSSHLTCHICEMTFDTPELTEQHAQEETCDRPVKCETCGLSFKTAQGYKVHAYTFCKTGPLSQSKCATCNHQGPRCLCQIHWHRTYSVAASFYEGTHSRGKWLSLSNTAPSILLAASVYLGDHTQKQKLATTPPKVLDKALWDPKQIEIPVRCNTEIEPAVYQEGKPLTIASISEEIADTLDIEMNILEYPYSKITDTPASTRKTAARRNIMLAGGVLGVQADQYATVEEYAKVTAALVELTKKMADTTEDQRNQLKTEMRIEEDDLMRRVETLNETRDALERLLFPKNTEESNKKVPIESNSTYDSDSDAGEKHEQSFNQDQKIKRPPHISTAEEKSAQDKITSIITGKNNAKEQASRIKGKKTGYTCKNEKHRGENPPYRVFMCAETKRAHLAREHKCPHYRDPIPCHFYYEMDNELGAHLIAKHPLQETQNICDICDAKVEKVHLEQHRSVLHAQCESCKAWFTGTPELKAHYAQGGGACLDTSPEPAPKPDPPAINSPSSMTLASLPKIDGGHEGYLTEAFGILLDSPPTPESKAKAKDLIAKYTFAERHIATISKNPWVAQSQTTLFLTPPQFTHPAGAKERSMDKVLEQAKTTDLSPFVARHFDNFLLADALNLTITQYTKQFYLTEQSAVYMFVQHLSQANQDTLRATYKRHAHELSYIEILSCIQKKYYNFDLRTLRDGVASLKRSQNEHMLEFYNRIYKLTTLAALNFQPHEKAAWVEQKTREIFYKGLDNSLKLEIDSIESKDGTHMTSSQLLETYICRQNLKASPLNLDDTLLNVARVKEHKPQPPRRRRINMVTSYGEVNLKKDDAQSTVAKSGPLETTQTPPNIRRPNKSSDPPKPRPLMNLARTAKPRSSFNAKGSPTRTHTTSTPRAPFRDSARQRLARPPSPLDRITSRRNDTRSGTTRPTSQPRRDSSTNRPIPVRKQLKDSTIELMKKLHLTRDTIDRVGVHCFRCGAGRPDISKQPFHTMNGCPFPNWTGDPHHCNEKVKLLHHPAQCPLKSRRISRIRIED